MLNYGFLLNRSDDIAKRAFGRTRFLVNLLSNSGTYVVSMLVGLWYTPYLLGHLPSAVYGLIPLATSFTGYLAIVTVSLAGSVGRFVTADVARNDMAAANRTFNTFLFGGLRVVGLLWLAALVFVAVLPVRVPVGQEFQARVLFLSLLTAFLISVMSSTLDASVWITSRYEIRAAAEMGATFLRIGLVVLLFWLRPPELWHVALAVQVAAWFQVAVLYRAQRRLTPELRIQPSLFDAATMRSIRRTGSWLMVNQLGLVLLLGVDMFLLNRLMGPESNAKYSVVLVWSSALRSLFMTTSTLFSTSVVAFDARERTDDLLRVTRMNGRMQGLAAAIATGLFCGLSYWALAVWLRKPWTAEVVPVAWALMIPLAVEAANMPLGAILVAEGRIRPIAIATCVVGVLAPVAGWILVRYFDLGMLGVALASGSASLVRFGVLTPLFVSRSLRLPWGTYLITSGWTLLAALLFGLAAWSFGRWFEPSNWPGLIAAGACAGLVFVAVGFAALSSGERSAVLRLVSRRGAGV